MTELAEEYTTIYEKCGNNQYNYFNNYYKEKKMILVPKNDLAFTPLSTITSFDHIFPTPTILLGPWAKKHSLQDSRIIQLDQQLLKGSNVVGYLNS